MYRSSKLKERQNARNLQSYCQAKQHLAYYTDLIYHIPFLKHTKVTIYPDVLEVWLVKPVLTVFHGLVPMFFDQRVVLNWFLDVTDVILYRQQRNAMEYSVSRIISDSLSDKQRCFDAMFDRFGVSGCRVARYETRSFWWGGASVIQKIA